MFIHNSQDMETFKCPSTDEWYKKMWDLYTMEFHSAIKKEQNNAICSNMDATRSSHTKKNELRERQISYDITDILNLEYGTYEQFTKQKQTHRHR